MYFSKHLALRLTVDRDKMDKLVGVIVIAIFLQCCFYGHNALAKNINNARITGKTQQGWAICQSGTYGAVSEFTPNAIRLHIDNIGLTIIAKSPKWDAIAFNDNSKTCVHLPYSDWQKKINLICMNNHKGSKDGLSLFARTTGRTLVIGKHPCTEYWILTKADPKMHVTEKKIAQIWTATDVKLPLPIAQIYYKRLGIPTQRGVPLRLSSCDDSGKLVSKLETISIEQHEIPCSTFEPLPGYKNVKNEMELLIGKSTKEMMADMLDVPINEKATNQLR
jgi:hypothetical protein